jgi:hypothetical protein
MRRSRLASLALAALLCGAGPPPAPDTTPRPVASNESIADQFAMLAFDADPAVGGLPREHLARWRDEARLFVSGTPPDVKQATDLAATLSKLTGVPIEPVAGGSPNLLVAVTADPEGVFGGPLRRLLLAAFAGDETAVDDFTVRVVKIEPCWVLAIWGDVEHTAIKAAVIGIDALQPRAGIERCMAQKLAAAMGLLGPSGYLPRSVFAPQTGATRYSLEDTLMLRLLYSTALRPGMTRDQAHAAALAALPGLRHR